MSKSPYRDGDPVAPLRSSKHVPERPLQFGLVTLFAMVTSAALVAGALQGAGEGVAISLAICIVGLWMLVIAIVRGGAMYAGALVLAFGVINLAITLLMWGEAVLHQSVK